jgi:chemotaxis signal transduction protein
VAKSAGETFGIPTENIIRVLRNLTIHGVPGAGAPMIGLTQYAGEPVPVIDLVELAAGEKRPGSHSVVVLLRCGTAPTTEVVGVAIDEAVRLVTADVDFGTQAAETVVSGMVCIEGVELRLVNPEKIGNNRVGATS